MTDLANIAILFLVFLFLAFLVGVASMVVGLRVAKREGERQVVVTPHEEFKATPTEDIEMEIARKRQEKDRGLAFDGPKPWKAEKID